MSGIEVDNDIPGRYESFVHPEAKLKALHDVAEAAHKAGNHVFVYIAGTECITAHGDKVEHTLAKHHPDWLQRKVTAEPAIFGGGTAFWIAPGDEDAWVSPFATEWRKIYMERSDAGFRKWVDFRIQTFTDFMAEIDHTAKAVNPEIKTIPEIYPGIEEEAVRVERMGPPRDFDRLPAGRRLRTSVPGFGA